MESHDFCSMLVRLSAREWRDDATGSVCIDMLTAVGVVRVVCSGEVPHGYVQLGNTLHAIDESESESEQAPQEGPYR